ncbi:sporulation protein [bacterium]|nr:sporulation protein [bacterium]
MSDSTASQILETLMKNLQELVSTKSIVGEPIQAGKATILPIMKVTLGFGAGGGTASDKVATQGGGGGGGVSITPVGFLVVEDGKTMMITPGHSKWDWIAESVPELWEKFSKFREKSKAAKKSDTDSKDAEPTSEA